VQQLPNGCVIYRHPRFEHTAPPLPPRRTRRKTAEPQSPAASMTMPFGKYKGRPLADIVEDANYAGWLLLQPWFAEKFPEHRAYIEAMRNVDTGPSAA
jgi:hypothetical protein